MTQPSPDPLIGRTFHAWTVIASAALRGSEVYYQCRCACGTTKEVRAYNIVHGYSKSCGCRNSDPEVRKRNADRHRTHNLTNSAEYKVWRTMKTRCKNPKAINYHLYGGRGIKVCPEWDRFEAFLRDVGNRPSAKHTLHRKDNDGDYEPGNVCWATNDIQSSNRRTTRRLRYGTEELTISEWERRAGLSSGAINSRLKRGWTVEQALTTPSRAPRSG